MTPRSPHLDPLSIAQKLQHAAAELRQGRLVDLSLAQRIERRAEAILQPDLPRWWHEPV